MPKNYCGWLAGTFVLLAPPAFAIDPAPPVPASVPAQPAAIPTAPNPAPRADGDIRIPALTEVRLEILSDLGSKISKTGELFPIRLAKPIVIDGAERVPAGAEGQGEVVWAKKSGGSGASGELVLAAAGCSWTAVTSG